MADPRGSGLSAGAEEPAAQHEFGEEYRPVKLEVAVEVFWTWA